MLNTNLNSTLLITIMASILSFHSSAQILNKGREETENSPFVVAVDDANDNQIQDLMHVSKCGTES